jgi:hypothetical protein
VDDEFVTELVYYSTVPIIFVKLVNGDIRIRIDDGRLKILIARDRYSLSYMKNILDRLYTSIYFTKLDIFLGYH